jgi:aryl-alcohol dehydrogenase-like predicted oxidoreductase
VEGRCRLSRSRPARIRKEIEDSLRRLRTDVIDLYQVHWPDFETPIAETARTLEDLRRNGKIRAIGVSNFSPTQMRMFSADAQLDAVQPPYNLFERAIEADVLPYALGAGLTVLSYGALCRGLLSGRMTADTKFDGDDLRKVDPKFQGKRFRQYLTAVDELKRIAHEHAREAMNRWAKKLTIEGSESVTGGVGRITGRPRKGRFRLGPLTGTMVSLNTGTTIKRRPTGSRPATAFRGI